METAGVKCAVLACERRLRTGDVYYALGGHGRVVTCEACACETRYTLQVSGRPREFRRGWDVCARHLRRVMQ